MKYFALTPKGLDRVEQGLSSSLTDAVLDTVADFEEVEPLQPHSETAIIANMYESAGLPYEVAERGLRGAVRRGYLEMIFPGDERFPDWES